MDYSKLKVTELKDELKARGIPLTGLKLKQNFIDKLLELDAAGNAGKELGAPAEKHGAKADTPAPEPEAEPPTLSNPQEAPLQGPNGFVAPSVDDVPMAAEPPQEDSTEVVAEATTDTGVESLPVTKEKEAPTSTEVEDTATPEPTPTAQQSTPASIPSVPAAEIAEDSKKRKRRSVTPPPSAADIAKKKAKVLDGTPVVTKIEKDEPEEKREESSTFDSKGSGLAALEKQSSLLDQMKQATEDKEAMIEGAGLPDGPEVEMFQISQMAPKADEKRDDADPGLQPITEQTMQNERREDETPITQSPEKGHDGARSHKRQSPSPVRKPTSPALDSDRAISPAVHPATSSLYIRNFKRPLHVPTLRSHLASLAAARNARSDEDPIKQFYLDSVRTHALVTFTSISTASRVRSLLHDSRFPDEKTREPLWVDFVPDDKVQGWIELEADTGGRGGVGKRYEVIYQEGSAGMEAILEEVGGMPGARKPSGPMQRQASMQEERRPSSSATGVHPDRARLVPHVDAPGPSSRRPDARAQRQEDTGTGFQALDELFMSTTTKPKLYFQPVPKDVAEKRLDMIKDLRVGYADMGKSGDPDMVRYTFEMYKGEEEWVDKGPEFGYGRRGQEMLRGGTRGGYRGRGRGGFRDRAMDDAWRPPPRR